MDKPHNYGDLLTPFLLSGLRIRYRKANGHSTADAIMVGSIARFARSGMRVMGSGFIHESDPVCNKARYLWVRGPLSRGKILAAGGACPEIYGDAAWLLPELIKPADKLHDVGLVPHYVDHADMVAMNTGMPVVDLLQPDIRAVTNAITSFRTVISSSLHGVIVAHAYGIPAAWVPVSDRLKGDGFKFRDHYASIGLDAIPSTMDNPVFTVGSLDTRKIKEALLCCR